MIIKMRIIYSKKYYYINNLNQNLEFVFSPETSTETMKKKDHEAFDVQFFEEDQNILNANHHRNVDL